MIIVVSPCLPLAATPGQDYSAVEDSVSLPAGYTSGDLLTNELTVPIRDDELLENRESFEVLLRVESENEGVVLGTPRIMTIMIEDNDSECVYMLLVAWLRVQTYLLSYQ